MTGLSKAGLRGANGVRCRYQPKEKAEQGLSDVLSVFRALDVTTYHMIGNHCLYNLPRVILNERCDLLAVVYYWL